jgi:uncharacterized protein
MQNSAGKVLTREEIITSVRRLKEKLAIRYKVNRIGLFGSYARNQQKITSDIDLLVDFFPGADLFDMSGLKNFLEDEFHHPVDIVPTRALRDELRSSVLADVTYI